MKTLVIGLGNPILGDDGVGWRVVEEVAQKTANRPEVEVDRVSLGGLSLMERLNGYERAILVDAIFTGQKPVGTVSQFTLSDIPDLTAGHSASAHDTSLRNALNVGRGMNVLLPKDNDVIIVAIEAENVYDFTEELSPAVVAAVPQAVNAVLELVA
ncbi:MAG: hydrogenase maturation protease [Chloroflexota bacterium]